MKNFKWTCRKIATREEADEYALGIRDEAHATKLFFMNSLIPEFLVKVFLESRPEQVLEVEG